MSSTFITALWEFILWALIFTVFIGYLMALFSIIIDLFRDTKLNGFAKAIWFLALIFFPLVTALIYLVVRGRGMTARSMAQHQAAQDATDAYIRQVAGSPAADIAKAKELLDAGAINAAEFDQLKAAALAR